MLEPLSRDLRSPGSLGSELSGRNLSQHELVAAPSHHLIRIDQLWSRGLVDRVCCGRFSVKLARLVLNAPIGVFWKLNRQNQAKTNHFCIFHPCNYLD
jgi:hypothetical protein